MSTEKIYENLMSKFKDDLMSALDEAHSEIQGSMMPHITDDTNSNAGFRAAEMVGRIMTGEFEMENGRIYVDGLSVGVINDFNYNRLVDVLAAVAGDAAKDAKIRSLECEVRQLMEVRK